MTSKRHHFLDSRDLLASGNKLASMLRNFLQFNSHTIYFPVQYDEDIVLLSSEKRLLIPLSWQDSFIGMLMLDGIRAPEARRVMPVLPQIIRLILQNMAISKWADLDKTTGLLTEEALFSAAAQSQSWIQPTGSGEAIDQPSGKRMCLGVIVINWRGSGRLARQYGYGVCEDIFSELARRLKAICAEDVLISRIGRMDGRFEFCLLFPAIGRGACHKLARDILAELTSLSFNDPLSGVSIPVRLAAGHALYPHDVPGGELRRTFFEQMMLLRDRARLASRIAGQADYLNVPSMAFAWLVQKGGRILEVFSPHMARISPGIAMNAREGMRFYILSERHSEKMLSTKGQLVILKTGVNDSIAEIFHVEKADDLPRPGDRLLLINGPALGQADESMVSTLENDGENSFKLYSHGGFLQAFAHASKHCRRFAMAITRFEAHNENVTSEKFLQNLSDNFLAQNAFLLSGTKNIFGRYGCNCLVCYSENTSEQACEKFYGQLHEWASQHGVSLSTGIFSYPFLNFNKTDAEASAIKALEYAALLPSPHIGFFNFLALNISADKRFSQGDTLGAIEEYKLALALEPENSIALNSLGVCMAALGKLQDARKMFEKALITSQDKAQKAKIYYNLGTIYHKEETSRQAMQAYRKCLQNDPRHFYAWIKLGQIQEQSGRQPAARSLYKRARNLAKDSEALLNIVERNIARLETGQSNNDNARNLLHDALKRNPGDNASLLLLAKTYLNDREDAHVAEALARNSLALHDSGEAWQILAKALEMQGKVTDAELARQRAGTLTTRDKS